MSNFLNFFKFWGAIKTG